MLLHFNFCLGFFAFCFWILKGLNHTLQMITFIIVKYLLADLISSISLAKFSVTWMCDTTASRKSVCNFFLEESVLNDFWVFPIYFNWTSKHLHHSYSIYPYLLRHKCLYLKSQRKCFIKLPKPYVVKIKRGARNQCARNTMPDLWLWCLLQIVCFKSLLEKRFF